MYATCEQNVCGMYAKCMQHAAVEAAAVSAAAAVAVVVSAAVAAVVVAAVAAVVAAAHNLVGQPEPELVELWNSVRTWETLVGSTDLAFSSLLLPEFVENYVSMFR